MKSGRTSRADRLKSHRAGAWSTSSQDYAYLATQLFAHSFSEATPKNRYTSAYVFAGLPMLFAALRALLIECNSGVYGSEQDLRALVRLADEQNELHLLRDAYSIDTEVQTRLHLLYEARNEVVHPSHRPAGSSDQTPEYIRPLKEFGVLVTTNDPKSDYPWMAQLQSHKLFQFAFECIEVVVNQILTVHAKKDAHFECWNLPSYQRYKQFTHEH